MEEKWYHNAIVYALDVATYNDGDDNGIGDFKGLTARLPYLADLGITCIWLLPFYASPNLDDGYAVTNYYAVDNGLGSLDDFREFIRAAHAQDIRVIVDLVINHTSNEHHWFQDVLNDWNSPYRHYYLWSTKRPKKMAPRLIFPGVQKTNWTYRKEAKAYYWHDYYAFQPKLNYAYPPVYEEVEKIIEFWLKFDIDGFRIDSVPLMIAQSALPESQPTYPHQVLKYLAAVCNVHKAGVALLAEANLPPQELPTYFGNHDEMDLLYNFYINSYFFLALARQDATALRQAWEEIANVLHAGYWMNFMRTPDELSLERLTEDEQKEVLDALAPDKDLHIYGRGLRCRLPRVVENDRRRLEMAYSFAFSLPGASLLLYGEEIGMGANLALRERIAVRPPMQWSDEQNAGFSKAHPVRLVRPITDEGEYSYRKINVKQQQKDPKSFLNWMKRLIQVRKANPIFGTGEYEMWTPQDPRVFGLRYCGDGQQMLTMHSFSENPVQVEVEGDGWQTTWCDQDSRVDLSRSKPIELSPYGYCWLSRK